MSKSKRTIEEILAKSIEIVQHDDTTRILSHVLGRSHAWILAHTESVLTSGEYLRFRFALWQRGRGVPLAYITGEKEFYGRPFNVSRDTLIPRPESEHIIDIVRHHIRENSTKNFVIVDVGTGSGNLITTCVCELNEEKDMISFIGTDISQKAIRIAQQNAQKHGADDVVFFVSDLLTDEKLVAHLTSESQRENTSMIIIANLPYVDIDAKTTLTEKSISKGLLYEPDSALYATDGGMKIYKDLLRDWYHLSTGALAGISYTILLEIDGAQNTPLTHFVNDTLPRVEVETQKDLAGHDRVMIVSHA